MGNNQPAPALPAVFAAWKLFYGHSRKPIVSVVPDNQWPGMWRIAWPDRAPSDLTNLSRARDAALRWATMQTSARRPQRLHWRRE